MAWQGLALALHTAQARDRLLGAVDAGDGSGQRQVRRKRRLHAPSRRPRPLSLDASDVGGEKVDAVPVEVPAGTVVVLGRAGSECVARI